MIPLHFDHSVANRSARAAPPLQLLRQARDLVRSERQAGRIPFLRRIAEQAGLIAPVGPFLQLTPAAWDWLDWPAADRWRVLWDAWRNDAGWNELGVREPRVLPALRRELLAILAH